LTFEVSWNETTRAVGTEEQNGPNLKSLRAELLGRNIPVMRDNLEMPKRFNRRAVEQCYRHVYCTAKDGFVLA
jgi:hypothetical protein